MYILQSIISCCVRSISKKFDLGKVFMVSLDWNFKLVIYMIHEHKR